MPLFVIATPLTESDDLSPRAREILSQAEHIVGEEPKPTRQLLSRAGLPQKPIATLNEHSTAQDLPELVELCRRHTVALVSDCGTPGFCDPGADLVAACRRSNIQVRSVPGPSSLMAFLSVLGQRMDRFTFYGFLSRETEERHKELAEIGRAKLPTFLLETPYRFSRILEDCARAIPNHHLVFGLNLGGDSEQVIAGRAAELKKLKLPEKPELVLLVEPLKGHRK